MRTPSKHIVKILSLDKEKQEAIKFLVDNNRFTENKNTVQTGFDLGIVENLGENIFLLIQRGVAQVFQLRRTEKT